MFIFEVPSVQSDCCGAFRCWFSLTYRGEHLAGADAVVEAHPAVVVWVLARAQDVLIAHVVRLLIGYPVTAHDADGITAVEVPEGVHAVTAALPGAALEVAAFVEDNLHIERQAENTCDE